MARPSEKPRVPPLDVTEQEQANRRVWAAIQLALDVDACDDILRGEPVAFSRLDRKVYARTGRKHGSSTFRVIVTGRMLDAIANAGPIDR